MNYEMVKIVFVCPSHHQSLHSHSISKVMPHKFTTRSSTAKAMSAGPIFARPMTTGYVQALSAKWISPCWSWDVASGQYFRHARHAGKIQLGQTCQQYQTDKQYSACWSCSKFWTMRWDRNRVSKLASPIKSLLELDDTQKKRCRATHIWGKPVCPAIQ